MLLQGDKPLKILGSFSHMPSGQIRMISLKDKLLEKLKKVVADKEIIVGAAVGSGFAAKHAIKGGADLLLVLNAGRFRSAGISSLAAYMPFENCNDTVMRLGSKEIIPQAKDIPVIIGVCATDPYLNIKAFNKEIRKNGFLGINNFPTVSILDGNYRVLLEENGIGFDREVELIKQASQDGIFTVAFVFNENEAIEMVDAGVDMLCVNFGFTLGGYNGVKHGLSIQEATNKAISIFNAVDKIRPAVFKMVYGGPITNPDTLGDFIFATGAQGYIGGSAIERIPIENNITETMKEFKGLLKLKEENLFLKQQLARRDGLENIIGNSDIMQELYETIVKVAETDANVLITGESGTGKDLVSRAIHSQSKRKTAAYIKINCASIPFSLLESELFGHEKGAYTGAHIRHIGRFEHANGGTLFLDEIAEMDIGLQSKILRVIEDREFERVGGSETITVDVRLISATNQDLSHALSEKSFRKDLFYCLNVLSIRIPPLRERKEDIPLLVNYFINNINNKFGFNIKKIESAALDAVLEYDWPGNVRELEHALERAAVLGDKVTIMQKYLPENIYKKNINKKAVGLIGEGIEKHSLIQASERERVIQALEKNFWNITRAAENLDISRKTLYEWMKKLNIEKYSN